MLIKFNIFKNVKHSKFLLYNFILVAVFSVLYWLQDYLLTNYPVFFYNKFKLYNTSIIKYEKEFNEILENSKSNIDKYIYLKNLKKNYTHLQNTDSSIYIGRTLPFTYYFWFSLVTQTTVGYNDIPGGYFNNLSTLVKVFNITHLLSLFYITSLFL